MVRPRCTAKCDRCVSSWWLHYLPGFPNHRTMKFLLAPSLALLLPFSEEQRTKLTQKVIRSLLDGLPTSTKNTPNTCRPNPSRTSSRERPSRPVQVAICQFLGGASGRNHYEGRIRVLGRVQNYQNSSSRWELRPGGNTRPRARPNCLGGHCHVLLCRLSLVYCGQTSSDETF